MRKARKGFTLIELLIVIAILGTLSAAMSVSSSSATSAAKATTIYNNISTIKTAAVLYQLQEGNAFKESKVTAQALKDAELLDLDTFNKKGNVKNAIQYTITAGYDGGASAYVLCEFEDDNDYEAIAKALESYTNIRMKSDKKAVGAFLYHNTTETQQTGDNAPSYEADFFN